MKKVARVAGITIFMSSVLLILSNIGVYALTPPMFELKTMEGETYRLKDDLGNSVVILDFWATWCKPCMQELPHINKIYEAYKDKGLKVYAVSIDDAKSKSSVKPTYKRYKFTMPVLMDPDSAVVKKFSPNGAVPYLVLIGKDGEILREFSGYKPGDEKLVEDLVKEAIEKPATQGK